MPWHQEAAVFSFLVRASWSPLHMQHIYRIYLKKTPIRHIMLLMVAVMLQRWVWPLIKRIYCFIFKCKCIFIPVHVSQPCLSESQQACVSKVMLTPSVSLQFINFIQNGLYIREKNGGKWRESISVYQPTHISLVSVGHRLSFLSSSVDFWELYEYPLL